ncbi:MAG: class I SAM-dependent methyltransferase [Vallitaleaceae bacterium]|nr:class I SAM-dependent methyltransferase [Vallitaleaceae bacterium]
MQKVNAEFVRHGFASKASLHEYIEATSEIGLWESEKILFSKYLKKDDRILDLGCGTGRITFPLHQMGYKNIVGLDISSEMLAEAQRLNHELQGKIEFVLGDATALNYVAKSFDVVLFAYNGLMQIPWLENRKKAFSEICRILKPGGCFIFTTHDMEAEQDSYYFWREERLRWEKGRQNPRLAEFGDVIYQSGDCEMFMHVPKREEILSCIEENSFLLIEDHFRPEIFDESNAVKEFSDECRFWVCQKKD